MRRSVQLENLTENFNNFKKYVETKNIRKTICFNKTRSYKEVTDLFNTIRSEKQNSNLKVYGLQVCQSI